MRLMTLAAVLMFGASLAFGEDAAAELKIAVVNTNLAIGQTEEFTTFGEALEQEFAPEQAELQTLSEEIGALQQRVADERDVMSETELRGIQKEIESKQLDLEFRGTKFNKQVADRQNEFFQTMEPKFRAVVDDLIKIERYDFVVARRTVLFANQRHDITAKVTEKLNERYAETQSEDAAP